MAKEDNDREHGRVPEHNALIRIMLEDFHQRSGGQKAVTATVWKMDAPDFGKLLINHVKCQLQISNASPFRMTSLGETDASIATSGGVAEQCPKKAGFFDYARLCRRTS